MAAPYDIAELVRFIQEARGEENAAANILVDSVRQTPIPPKSPLSNKVKRFKATPQRFPQKYQSQHSASADASPAYVDDSNPLDTPSNYSTDPGLDRILAQLLGPLGGGGKTGRYLADPDTRPRGFTSPELSWEERAKVPLNSPYWPKGGK